MVEINIDRLELVILIVYLQLLNALVVSGSLVLLEVLINIMCREKKHVHEDRIQTSLIKFVKE